MDLLLRLVSIESPTDDVTAQREIQAILADELAAIGFRTRRLAGVETGGALFARPERRRSGASSQLLVIHSDTVWPVGTLETMPAEESDGILRGPGAFDAKGGVAILLRALTLLHEQGLEPEVTPVVLINADEEIGSPETTRPILRLARVCCRALVLEPGLGPEGRLKTARKGITRFEIR
ncbi:MAG: M20/M25/M40 family metallo-hydrolase, partial [Gemmatimonadota bacterium]|nr:M20/M25/M40 family metallo-hydrolase [Gemmatimonadota bacterium]